MVRRVISSRAFAYVVVFGTSTAIMVFGFVFGWWQALHGS